MSKFFALACVITCSSSCLAQNQLGTTTTTTTTTTAAPANRLKASQILGSSVHLQGTNNYGKVEDIILSDDGGPTYLLVSNAGRYVMMPLNAATFDQGQRSITYDVAPQAVQPLLFDSNNHPNVADQQFTTRTGQVFPAATGNEKVKIKVKPNGKVKEKIKDLP